METANHLFAQGSFDEAKDAQEKLLVASPDACAVIERPLPVLPIDVDGRRIFVFLDTGGAQLVLDPAFARENGIEAISQQEVKGLAGGKSAPVSFGKVQSVQLAGITVENVPVWLLDTRRFSEWFGVEINGILGTEILAQFLPTVDSPRRRLISHHFLKHYSWTIDFDNRYFIFGD